MPHNHQIQAEGHWCYSSMGITTIRYRQWDTGVTVLCASQLSDTGSGTLVLQFYVHHNYQIQAVKAVPSGGDGCVTTQLSLYPIY